MSAFGNIWMKVEQTAKEMYWKFDDWINDGEKVVAVAIPAGAVLVGLLLVEAAAQFLS